MLLRPIIPCTHVNSRPSLRLAHSSQHPPASPTWDSSFIHSYHPLQALRQGALGRQPYQHTMWTSCSLYMVLFTRTCSMLNASLAHPYDPACCSCSLHHIPLLFSEKEESTNLVLQSIVMSHTRSNQNISSSASPSYVLPNTLLKCRTIAGVKIVEKKFTRGENLQ